LEEISKWSNIAEHPSGFAGRSARDFCGGTVQFCCPISETVPIQYEP
jgi:hypothetical protein